MKILVTGASGFVGHKLVDVFIKNKHVVVGVGRQALSSPPFKYYMINDFTEYNLWNELLFECEVIVHLAARVHVMSDNAMDPLAEFRKVNVDGTLALALQAAQAGVKRFVYISSVKVNGEYTLFNKPFTEADASNPQDAYGISKLEAEQGLLLISKQSGMEVVIIRPPLVYGVGVKANFARMLRAVKRGIPLPFGAIHNKRSFIYVGNLVSLIMLCIDHPAAANEVFLVSDGNDLSTTELLIDCAKAMGSKPRLLPISQRLIEVIASIMGKKDVAQRLCGNLQVDITKARTLLGWIPPVTVEDGLKATAMALIEGK